MNKFEIAVSIITGVCLVGVIALIGFGKDTVILMPILTALVGWILGKKEETVLKAFKRNK